MKVIKSNKYRFYTIFNKVESEFKQFFMEFPAAQDELNELRRIDEKRREMKSTEAGYDKQADTKLGQELFEKLKDFEVKLMRMFEKAKQKAEKFNAKVTNIFE